MGKRWWTKKEMIVKNLKGVFERVPGSGQCWIRYADATGKIRREFAGTKSAAITLYRKRKTEVLMGKKLPETFRVRSIKFSELADDARQYCRTNNLGQQFDQYRIGRLVKEFGNRNADIPVEALRAWFSEQKWEAGTYNRYKSMLSLIYRLGMENGKVNANPARFLKHKREDNGRIRFLDQHTPDEEVRMRSIIAARYASHMPEFDIALHTGMRPSEQYGLAWDRVDLVRRSVTILKSKNGITRHIPLNSIALSAFRQLFQRSSGSGRVFVNIHGEPLKGLQALVRAGASRGSSCRFYLVLPKAHLRKPAGHGRG